MQRRKLIVGIGSLAAGGAAATSTGAFTTASVQDRAFTADVTADDTAIVGLDPTSPYATISGDEELRLDILDLNEDSTFSFEDLFNIVNNGQDTVDIGITVSGSSGVTNAIDAVPTTGGNGTQNPDLLSGQARLVPGNFVSIGVDLTIGDDNGGPFTGSFTINAEPP